MEANKVTSYVDAQVKALTDRTVAPLVIAINEELAGQTRNAERLAALKADVEKQNAESETRITQLQTSLGKAHQAANALAIRLVEATAGAVPTGQE